MTVICLETSNYFLEDVGDLKVIFCFFLSQFMFMRENRYVTLCKFKVSNVCGQRMTTGLSANASHIT